MRSVFGSKRTGAYWLGPFWMTTTPRTKSTATTEIGPPALPCLAIWLSLSSVVAMTPEMVLSAVVCFSTSARVAASISPRKARSKAGGVWEVAGSEAGQVVPDAHCGQGDTSYSDTTKSHVFILNLKGDLTHTAPEFWSLLTLAKTTLPDMDAIRRVPQFNRRSVGTPCGFSGHGAMCRRPRDEWAASRKAVDGGALTVPTLQGDIMSRPSPRWRDLVAWCANPPSRAPFGFQQTVEAKTCPEDPTPLPHLVSK